VKKLNDEDRAELVPIYGAVIVFAVATIMGIFLSCMGCRMVGPQVTLKQCNMCVVAVYSDDSGTQQGKTVNAKAALK